MDDPTTTALLAAAALDRAGITFALYGGLLLAAYGEPRETRDADLAVTEISGELARSALAVAGVDALLTFQDESFGGLVLHRITLLGRASSHGLNTVDLVRPRSLRYARAALDRAVTAPLRDVEIPVLTAEDFVVFKLLSTRDRDLEDARSVLAHLGELLDRDVIEGEVERLAREIPDFDVRARLAAIGE